MAPNAVTLSSEADTDRFGAILAKYLPARVLLGLIGTLGAGKTRLVRAIAAAAGIDPETVQSPTFVLCHEYPGQRRIYHLDTYRLKSVEEFLDLGVEEYWSAPGWTIIEWSDRVDSVLPCERIDLRIEIMSDDRREVQLQAQDAPLQPIVDQVIRDYSR